MERLERRIHQLELGEEIAAKDVKALLSAEQQEQLAEASLKHSLRKLRLRKTNVLALMQRSSC